MYTSLCMVYVIFDFNEKFSESGKYEKCREYSSSGNCSDTIGQTDIREDSAKLIVAYLSRRQLKHLHKYVFYTTLPM